jgi:hypothetical protein
MTINTTLEQRLSAVEEAIAQIQKQITTRQTNWLEEITGSFKDEPAFEDVLTLGRAIRQDDDSLLEAENES